MDENAVAGATVLATADQAPSCEPQDDSAQQFITETNSTTHVETVKEQVVEMLCPSHSCLDLSPFL